MGMKMGRDEGGGVYCLYDGGSGQGDQGGMGRGAGRGVRGGFQPQEFLLR